MQNDRKSFDNCNYHAHEQKTDINSVRGSYHVQLPDGLTQIVNYIADDQGYHTDISYVPTSAFYTPSTCPGCGRNNPPSYHQKKEEEVHDYGHYSTSDSLNDNHVKNKNTVVEGFGENKEARDYGRGSTVDYRNVDPYEFSVITGRSSSSPNGRFPPRGSEPIVKHQEYPDFPWPSENKRQQFPDEDPSTINHTPYVNTPNHVLLSDERYDVLRTPRVMSRDREEGKTGIYISMPSSRVIQSERVELIRKSLERDEENRRITNRDIIRSGRSHSSLYERLRPKLKPIPGNSEAQNSPNYSSRTLRTDARPFGSKVTRQTTNERKTPERKRIEGTPNYKESSSFRVSVVEKEEEEVTTTTVRSRPITRPRISRRKLDFYVSENESEQNDNEEPEVIIIPVETTEEFNPEEEIIYSDETSWEQDEYDIFDVENENQSEENNPEKDVAESISSTFKVNNSNPEEEPMLMDATSLEQESHQSTEKKDPSIVEKDGEKVTNIIRLKMTVRTLDSAGRVHIKEKNIVEPEAVMMISKQITRHNNPESVMIFMDQTPWEQEEFEPETKLNVNVGNNLEKDVVTEPTASISTEENLIQVDNYILQNSFGESISRKSYIFNIILIAIINSIFNVIMCY